MSPTFVLDASVTMSWCFADECTPALLSLLNRLVDEAAIVPQHWALEVANVLVVAQRRGRLSEDAALAFSTALRRPNILADQQTGARCFDDTLPLARKFGLSIYDAAYLELAARLRLPLATLDAELRRAARKLGVDTVGA